jgi:ArsR family transcriptional regulator
VDTPFKNAARFFKVLSDEARLKMLWLLFNHEELCVCDIMAALEVTQSKASRHLGALRHGGLVTGRRQGLWTHYALRPAADELARAQLDSLRVNLARRPDAGELLEKLHRWLKTRHRDATCCEGAACAVPTKIGAAAPASPGGPR